MRIVWPACLLVLLSLLLLPAPAAQAQWHDDDHPISITPPSGWSLMGEPLRAEVNRTVRLVTPGAYRVGYQAFENEVLLFPYLLVQVVPYSELPEDHRPTFRLDEHATLQLIARLVKQFGAEDPLPEGMTADDFASAYDRGVVRLVGVEADGTFELAGSFPLHDGGRQEYHTLGRVGREGIAFATVSTNEGLDTVEQVVTDTLGSLVFDEGAGFDALPEREPEVVGFLPPPAQPLPSGALLVGGEAFGVLPGDGYVPLPAGSFDTQEPRVASLLPEALRGVTLEQVMTQTPTSRRITRPWAAAAAVSLESVGLAGPLERRPSVAQWAGALETLIGIDPDIAQQQLGWLADDPGVRLSLTSKEDDEDTPPWRVESVEMEAGRVTLSRRVADTTDPTLLTRVDVTLVVGRSGVALLASESYRDATDEDQAALAAMHGSVRFVGGERLVDVPPAEGEGDPSAPTPGANPGETGTDTAGQAQPGDAAAAPADPGALHAGVDEDAPAPPTPAGGSMPLWLVLGGLGVVFLGVVVVVILTSHAKAKRRREKTRARRERERERGGR